VEFLPQEIDSFGMYVAFSKKSKCNALKARFAESIKKEVAEGRVKPLLDAAPEAGRIITRLEKCASRTRRCR